LFDEYLSSLLFQVLSLQSRTVVTSSPTIHPTSICIITFEGNAGVLPQVAIKAENSKFEDVMQLIRSALPEKAIDSAVKDFLKRLQARVLAIVG